MHFLMCILMFFLFNKELRGFSFDQKRREDSASPWNIPHSIGIFGKCVLHAVSCVFHWFMDQPICSIIRRWLNNYMQNWRAKVNFRRKESKSRMVKTGVEQGGVMSPSLFNYYLADFPTPPPNINLIKYADDITIYTSGPVVADIINGLNIYMS